MEKRNLQERENPSRKCKYIAGIEDQSLKQASMKIIRQKNYKSNNNYNKQLRDYHEDVKYNIKNKMWGRGVKICRFFRVCFNLNDHPFKTSRYSYRSTYTKPMITQIKHLQ